MDVSPHRLMTRGYNTFGARSLAPFVHGVVCLSLPVLSSISFRPLYVKLILRCTYWFAGMLLFDTLQCDFRICWLWLLNPLRGIVSWPFLALMVPPWALCSLHHRQGPRGVLRSLRALWPLDPFGLLLLNVSRAGAAVVWPTLGEFTVVRFHAPPFHLLIEPWQLVRTLGFELGRFARAAFVSKARPTMAGFEFADLHLLRYVTQRLPSEMRAAFKMVYTGQFACQAMAYKLGLLTHRHVLSAMLLCKIYRIHGLSVPFLSPRAWTLASIFRMWNFGHRLLAYGGRFF